MDFFEHPYFKFSRFFMILMGQWPYDNSKMKSFQRAIITVIGAIFANSQVLKFTTEEFNLNLFLEVSNPLLICVLCYTKYYTNWYNADVMKELLERIKYDWSTFTVKSELRILEKHTEEGKSLVIIYMTLIYAAMSLYVMVQVLPNIIDIDLPLNMSQARYILFAGEFLVSQDEYFYYILFFTVMTSVLALSLAAASDFIFISIVFHGCGLFSVLGYRLEHMFDDGEQKRSQVYNSRGKCLLCDRLIRSVQLHKKNIEYVAMINSCYAASLVVQVFLSLLILTFLLLRMSESLTRMNDFNELIVCTIHAGGYLFLTFLNILPAQKLLDCSSDIFYRTYYARWYQVPLKVQKLLLLIMQKSLEPCGVTIAKVLTASLEIFATIVQMSLSYFTVLYSVRQ